MDSAATPETPTLDYPQEFLTAIAEKKIDKREVGAIISEFGMTVSLAEFTDQAKAIVVTDENQIDLMQMAREMRLRLKAERVRIDKVRAEIKEPYLRKTQVIDGIALVVRRMFENVENHLQQQEDFARNKAEERRLALHEARVKQLCELEYVGDMSGLGSLSDEQFQLMVGGARTAFDAKKAAEEQALLEAKERAERENNLRIENERLKLERDEADQKTREAEAEANRQKEETARIEREAQAEKQRQIDESARIERERIAAEDAETRRIADEKARAQAAPDREKLIAFANAIEAVELPVLISTEGNEKLYKLDFERGQLIVSIKTAAEQLRATTTIVNGIEVPF